MGMKLDERIARISNDIEKLSKHFDELQEHEGAIVSEQDIQTVFDQIKVLHSANAHCIEECVSELNTERRAFEKCKLHRMIKKSNKNRAKIIQLAEQHHEFINRIREKNK